MSMTESEAIKRCNMLVNGFNVDNATETAFTDIERGYATFATMVEFAETCKMALEIVQELHAIGTVSEFQQLKEKAIKKVEKCKDKYYCMCGCPVEIMLDGITLKPIGGQVYCDQCGAKLDWSEFVEKGE